MRIPHLETDLPAKLTPCCESLGADPCPGSRCARRIVHRNRTETVKGIKEIASNKYDLLEKVAINMKANGFEEVVSMKTKLNFFFK